MTLWLLWACSGPATPPADTDTDADADTDTDADADTDTDADADTDSDADTDADTDSDTPVPTDFTASGPFGVTVQNGQLALTGCNLAYTAYLPDGDANAPLLVLHHGFLRGPGDLANLARHVSTHGIRVVTPALCHSVLADSDPAQNGLETAQLGEVLAPTGPIAYAGHSNGGLAALFAGATDPDTLGILGLDPVDTDGVVGTAGLTTQPIWGLFGEAAACNDQANLIEPLRALGARLDRVDGANHCDFEAPTDLLCTLPCGGASGARPLIQGLVAAWAAATLGTDPTGEAWTTGSRYQALVTSGDIEPL